MRIVLALVLGLGAAAAGCDRHTDVTARATAQAAATKAAAIEAANPAGETAAAEAIAKVTADGVVALVQRLLGDRS